MPNASSTARYHSKLRSEGRCRDCRKPSPGRVRCTPCTKVITKCTITSYVSASLKDHLKRAARAEGLSPSLVIRSLVVAWLEEVTNA